MAGPKKIFPVFLPAAIALAAFCPSDWAIRAEAQCFTTRIGAQRTPAISVDDSDNLYLAMSGATGAPPFPRGQIFFTVSRDGGATWDNLPQTRNISNSPEGKIGAINPSLAVSKDGPLRIYVVYDDDSPGSTQVFFVNTKKKTKFRAPRNITPADEAAFSPHVAVDSTGAVNIVWGNFKGNSKQIIFVRSTDLGASFSDPVNISQSSGFSFDPDIAIDSSDGINVVWQDSEQGSSLIMFARSTDGGRSFSKPKPISNIGDVARQCVTLKCVTLKEAGRASEPRITADSRGGIDVVWIDENAGVKRVMFVRSTDGGATFSSPTIVSGHPDADLHKPFIATFKDTFYVAYQTSDSINASGQVFLVRSDDAGRSFSRPVQVSNANPSRGGAHSPAMVIDSQGKLHIVWIDTSIIGNQEGLLFYSSTNDGRTFSAHLQICAAL
jgi:hypothetical protein